MIDGYFVVDAHVHTPRLPTLKPAWLQWAHDFAGAYPWRSVYSADGAVIPPAMDELMESEGVDRVLLFCEYSPRATGIQPIEDNLPLVEHNPARFRLVANVNPYVHHPAAAEVARQLDRGAVALKIHPVHGAFSPADKELYVAAFLALARENVWLDLAGLPPKKLPEYYQRFDLDRLAGKFVFGTDWPGVPSVAANVRTLAGLGLPEDVLSGVLGGNAVKLMPGLA
ncbi:amidohydrolase family protein [Amycolatopsis sp. NPDC051045]|uniref:amidohydrolase family protein n=1 Tax=Amycolatopsis sp. NPDC051045 TaxID=3156922 RepID=UPI00342D66F4